MSTAAQRAHQMAEQGAAAHRAATDPTPAERYATERAAGFNRAEAFLFTAVYLTGLHARDDAALGADVRQLFVAHRADHPGATS